MDSTTPTTTSTTTTEAERRYRRELKMIYEDLRLYGRSTAADRAIRLDAEDAARLARKAAKKAETEARRAERRLAIIEARVRFWTARGKRPRVRR